MRPIFKIGLGGMLGSSMTARTRHASVVRMRMPKKTATAFSERKPARMRSKRRVATSASELGILEPIWCRMVTMLWGSEAPSDRMRTPALS